jgi:hypothetical protein
MMIYRKSSLTIAVILGIILALALAGCGNPAGDPPGDPPEDDDDFFDPSSLEGKSALTIENTGGGVTEQDDSFDTMELEIVQTIPSFSSGGQQYNISKSLDFSSSSNNRAAGSVRSAARAISGGTQDVYAANAPLIFFFDDKIFMDSIEDNFDVYVNNQAVDGSLVINEDAHGNAILTFTPSTPFAPGVTITVVIKDGIEDDGGNGMDEDLVLRFKTVQGASGVFNDNNRGFENGTSGVSFIGDGAVLETRGPLVPHSGSKYAAISSGEHLVSSGNNAINSRSSLMSLGPINETVSSLSFYFDFISAEFDEYIDSAYDDTAMVTIYGPGGSHSEFITSVNGVYAPTAAFNGYPGMPDDGDSKAGHTGWTKYSIDGLNVGSPAYIVFTVSDVSDLIYSSILAIDDLSYSPGDVSGNRYFNYIDQDGSANSPTTTIYLGISDTLKGESVSIPGLSASNIIISPSGAVTLGTLSGPSEGKYVLTVSSVAATRDITVRVEATDYSFMPGAGRTIKVYDGTGSTGGLTVSNLPDNSFYLYAVNSEPQSIMEANAAAANAAGSGYFDYEGGFTWLITPEDGTYTILLVSGDVYTCPDVEVSGGIGSCDFNDFEEITALSSGGVLTINGIPAGDYVVYAVTGNPATVSAVASTVVGAGAIESGTFLWLTQPPNGTYAIVLVSDSSAYKATGITLTGGAGSVNYSAFTNLPLY